MATKLLDIDRLSNRLIRNILSYAAPTELTTAKHVNKRIRKIAIKLPPFNAGRLPNSLIDKMLTYLPPSDLQAAMCVSKRMSEMMGVIKPASILTATAISIVLKRINDLETELNPALT